MDANLRGLDAGGRAQRENGFTGQALHGPAPAGMHHGHGAPSDANQWHAVRGGHGDGESGFGGQQRITVRVETRSVDAHDTCAVHLRGSSETVWGDAEMIENAAAVLGDGCRVVRRRTTKVERVVGSDADPAEPRGKSELDIPVAHGPAGKCRMKIECRNRPERRVHEGGTLGNGPSAVKIRRASRQPVKEQS